MSKIPEEVKKVKPEKTDVLLKNGVYKVYNYESIWNKEKKRSEKHLKGCVGEIVFDNEKNEYIYNKREDSPLTIGPEVKTYGNFALLDSLAKDIYKELVQFYGKKDGSKIYVYSLLRILSGDVNSALCDEYENSYISEVYPNVSVSKDAVLDFIKVLGKHDGTNHEFLKSRMSENPKVLIFDGTRIDDCATEAGMVEFGKDAQKTNNSQFIKVRVFDIDRREPVYYEIVPGNVVDKTSFIDILSLFDSKNAIIIADKGFNSTENIEYLIQNDYNFIIPMNDNSTKKITLLKENKYTDVFKLDNRLVKGFSKSESLTKGNIDLDDKSIALKENKTLYYYVFNDPSRGHAQENKFISDIIKEKKGKTVEKLNEKSLSFGTIGFYSNVQKSCEEIYGLYYKRWQIESNFRLEKTTLENEAIRVHSTYGIYGVNFLIEIEQIIITRLYNLISDKGLLTKYSLKNILRKLSRTYVIYRNKKWRLSITTKAMKAFMKELGVQTTI